MTELLELLKEGRTWTTVGLAERLHTDWEDVQRKLEFLEQAGYIKQSTVCYGSCKGCSAQCGSTECLSSMPVFWEIKENRRDANIQL